MLFVLYIYYRLKIASADECSHRKGNQGVDDARNDPLLNQGQQKVDPDNHFQGPTQQEPARDVRKYPFPSHKSISFEGYSRFSNPQTSWKVDLVAKGRGQPKVVEVVNCKQKFRFSLGAHSSLNC